MAAPKPIVITQAEAGGAYAPQPFAVDITEITGYSAGATQSLKHVSGVLQWVTDV